MFRQINHFLWAQRGLELLRPCIQTIVSNAFSLFVVADPDIVAGLGEGVPGDVEPGGCSQELVGEVVTTEEVDEALELSRIYGADVSSLAEEMLGIANAPYPAIDSL